MSPEHTVAEKAKPVIAKVRPGPGEARRSLPIRREPDEIRARFDEPELRAAILEGIPADEASIEVGGEDRGWGRTVTLTLHLSSPVPGIGAQALAGKALRRLKALCETGEIPNSDFNPAARDDAGERSA